MTLPATTSNLAPGCAPQPSRRGWLKGLGALLGASLLTAPARLLAQPAGAAPASATAEALAGGDEYIGMVKLLAGPTVPPGWTLCEGQLLPVSQHPALFALLRYTYGGDGRTTFALPKLNGAAPTGIGPVALLCAIKTANGPATTNALAELQLAHQRLAPAQAA